MKHSHIISSLSVAMVLALGHSARAASATWASSPADATWTNGANWGGSAPGGSGTTNSTDVATFNSAIGTYGGSANPIQVDSGRNVAELVFTGAAGNYVIGGNQLTLTSGGSGGNSIALSGSLTSTNAIETINAPIRLEGTAQFINNSANGTGAGAGTLVINGNITQAAAGVLTLTGNNTNANTISGAIGGGGAALSLIKSGPGTWVLTGANTYTGSTGIAGILTLSGANGALGGTSSISISSGGTFNVDDRGVGAANANRLNNSAGITMSNGSVFNYFGSDQASTNSSETLGPLTFSSGEMTVSINYGGTNSAVLTTSSGNFTTVAGTGGVALINGANLGKDGTSTSSLARLIFAAAPTMVGSTAALSTGINTASKSTQVVLGVLGEATATSGGLGTATGTANTFLTYNSATGVRPLNLTDEFNNNAIAAGNNTYITASTTAASTTSINSLIINGGDLKVASGATLTDASGMLFFSGNGSIKPVSGTATLDFGSAEGYLIGNAGVTATIGTAITGTGGLSIYGGSTFDLAGASGSGLTGTLNLSSASTLEIGNNNALGSMTVANNGGTILSDNQARTIANTYLVVGNTSTIGGSNDLTFAGSTTPAMIIGNISNSGRIVYFNNTGTTTISGTLSLNNANSGSSSESIHTGNSANVVITGPIQDNNSGNASGSTFTIAFGGVDGNITIAPTAAGGNAFLSSLQVTANTYNTLTVGGVNPLGTSSVVMNNVASSSVYFQALTNNYTLANNLSGGGSGGSFGFAGANNLTLSGNYNTGAAAQITNLSTATLTLSGTVTVAAGNTLSVVGSGNTAFTNTFAATTGSLAETGTGTVTLGAVNNLTGTNTFSGGTVVLDYSGANANRLAQSATASAAALTLNGVNLQLKGGSQAQTLGTGNGTTIGVGQSTITQTGSGSSTIALGNLTRAANSGGVIDFAPGVATTTTTNSAGIIGGFATVNGADWAVAGSGGAITALASGGYTTLTNGTLSAAGNYYFTGSSPLTTSATTQTINSLKLDATGTLNLGGTMIISTGGLLFTGSGNETITGGALKTNASASQDLIVNQYGTGTLTIASTIANTNNTTALTKTGTGALVLSGTNTYTGGTFIDEGALSVSADNNLGGTGSIVFAGGTLESTASFSSARAVTLNANGGTFQVDTGTLTLTGAVGSNVYGGFTKTGAGTLLLSGADTYSGPTNINAGTLKVGSATALGSNAAVNARSTSPVTVNANGTLDIAGFAVNIANLTLAGGTISDSVGTGTLTAWSYNMQSGSVGAVLGDTGNGAAVNANNANTSTSTALDKTTSGTVTMTGNNTYSGATLISGGTLQIGNNGTSGTLGSGNVTDNATLAFNRSNAYTVANAISGSGVVTQVGSGTTTLTNTNAYSGGTTISNGALSVIGSTGAGLMTVGGINGGGSTATLTGTGLINGAVTTSSSNGNIGHIAAGVNTSGNFGSAGTLTVAGAVTIGTGTALDFDLNTATTIGGGVNDLIAMTGTGANGVLTIGSTLTINLNALGVLTTGSTTSNFYTLISGAASSSGLGTATYTTSVTGSTYTAHIFASGNNLDVYFTSVNGTSYSLATTAAATLLHQGATTTLTTTVTNTGNSSADTLNYSGLGASSSLGNGTGTASSGGPVANNNGTATNTQTYTATNVGTDTITSTGSGTNATAGGSATLGSSTGTTISVYSGQSTWATNGSGSWGTLTGTGTETFGANWGTNQGSPGLDSNYQGVDKATFGAQTVSAATVSLNGAAPNLNSITFSSPNTSYTLAQGTGSNRITLSGTTPSINVTGSTTAGTQTISAPLVLGANTSVNVGSKQKLNLSGVISGAGAGAAFTGAGATLLSADNTYTGGTTISGTVYVNNAGGASYSAPATSTHAAITATNSTGSGLGTGSVTVQSGGTLAGSGTIKSTSGGVLVQSGGTLASGGIQSGTSAGQGLTINNAAGLSSALTINGGATLSFALGSTTAYNGGSGALNFADPNTNSTYLSLTGSTVDQIFSNTSIANTINLVDLTAGSSTVSLTLRSQNPYLLIQTELGNNADFANLWTSGGEGQNGYVLGVSDGSATGYTAFSLAAYDNNGNLISSSTNLQGLQLYLYNGDLEVVPEPGTWALMLGGLALLVVIQRRKRMQ